MSHYVDSIGSMGVWMMASMPRIETSHDQHGGGDWAAELVVHRGIAPLHTQIHDLVRQEIEEGRLASGMQLPSEGNLAARWGVSVAPVRHALLDLAAEGYLERTQGRGTFVRQPKIEEKLSILSSFNSSHGVQAERFELVMRSSALVPPVAEVATALNTGKRKLVLIQRVAYLGSSPVALLSAYLDPDRFPGLETRKLEGGSLYRTLAEVYGVELVRAQTVLEAVPSSDEEGALLGLRKGAIVLAVASITHDRQDVPVEYSRVLYRMERFKFSLESHRFGDRIMHFPTLVNDSEDLAVTVQGTPEEFTENRDRTGPVAIGQRRDGNFVRNNQQVRTTK